MGALVGLGVGTGLLLIWSAFAVPRTARPAREGPGRLERTLAAAGITSVTPTSLVALCASSAVLAALVVQVASGTPTVALAFGVIAGYLPLAVVRGRAVRRQRELAEVWPDAVDNLASAVRAGMSLPDALAGLGVRGPEPLRDAFTAFGLDYQVSGRFGDCLDRLKARLADPVGELEARQAWTVNGARLAVAAPWVVLLLMSFQTEVIRRYASGAGVVVLAVGAGLCLVAYRLMMRIGRLPVERRILS